MKKIFAVHEYGSPSHFNALNFLVQGKGGMLNYRELNLYRQLGRSIKHIDLKQFSKFLLNVCFLLSIPFRKPCKIVLAVAPYNHYLKVLSVLFSRHEVYYFTSYTCWDQSRMVHYNFYSKNLLLFWKDYLRHRVRHIFAVSEFTKRELIVNGFSSEENITVVNHSFEIGIEPDLSSKLNLNFITVATLDKKKGIDELIEIFKLRPELNLTIVGKGVLLKEVIEASKNFPNIHYKGYIHGLKNLVQEYKQHSFLLLNSKRTEIWEELFGMVIIEGMACGLIPITTNHPGPQEIIKDMLNGFITDEGDISSGISKALNLSQAEYIDMVNQAIQTGKEYSSENISLKWSVIIDT